MADTTTRTDIPGVAKTMGSGSLDVFATPSMVALMEEAACNALAGLSAGETTVGTRIDTSHLAATVFGATVTAEATVTAVEGKKLDFTVEAKDSTGKTIGKGAHTRFVVESEKFMARAAK